MSNYVSLKLCLKPILSILGVHASGLAVGMALAVGPQLLSRQKYLNYLITMKFYV